MIDSNGPCCEFSLSRFEAAIDCRLPTDYRDFLLAHNGGRPSPDEFRIADRGDLEPVMGVIYLHGLRLHEPGLSLEQHLEADLIPRTTDSIVIGDSTGGCKLLLRIHGRNRGEVAFWDFFYSNEKSSDGLWRLASSFGERHPAGDARAAVCVAR